MYSVAHQMMEVEPMFCEKLWAPRYKKTMFPKFELLQSPFSKWPLNQEKNMPYLLNNTFFVTITN